MPSRLSALVAVLIIAGGSTMALSPHDALAKAAVRAGVHGLDSAPPVMDYMSGLSAARASTPATVAPRPQVMPRLAKPGPQKEVMGFVNAGNLGDPNVGWTSWDLHLLTSVVYFAIHVNAGDGHLVTTDTGWAVYHSQTMTGFVNAAHAAGVRVLVSINLHDMSIDPNNQVCQGLDPNNTPSTIQQTLAQVAWAGIDGVNVNYEATDTTCANGARSRDEFTAFVANFRAAMPAGMYLAVDSYSGSAEDNLEFFNVTGLAPSIDAFFVMAYDMDQSNWLEAPLNCLSYCMNPVSPLNTYRFNVSKTIAQYTALVPAKKVIIGQPYYGRRGCVYTNSPAHQILLHDQASPTYIFASTVPSQSGVLSYQANRDPGDGVSEWDTWYDLDFNCAREQYFDDTWSLGAKYQLINQSGVAGVGLFTLDYGGGSSELWSQLNTYFSCPVTMTLPASATTTTQFSITLSAGSCAVAYYDIAQYDDTLHQGWFGMPSVTPSGNVIANGYAGHTYDFIARAHSAAGVTSSWTTGTMSVSATATKSYPWAGLYMMDVYGGLHYASSPPLGNYPSFSGPLARAVKALPGANAPQNGFVLDAYGGLHPYGTQPVGAGAAPYYAGNDIARDFVFTADGTGGYELDGYGGIHPFTVGAGAMPPQPVNFPYFAGRDVAKKILLLPDGSGGYVLDAFGGLHPWATAGHALPVGIAAYGYWAGSNIARDVWLAPDSTAAMAHGYVIDAYGGFHAFWSANATAPAAMAVYGYWAGQDIARSMFFVPGSTASTATGYTLDASGGIHPFAASGQALPPALLTYGGYWPGQDLAKALVGA